MAFMKPKTLARNGLFGAAGLALTNRKLAPAVDTLFLMTSLEHAYLSSTLVKEIASFGGDVARLFVSKCHANNGPSQKRVRPAPMGRAFRIVKRTTHLTVEVTERAQVIKAVAAEGAPRAAKPAKSTVGSATEMP